MITEVIRGQKVNETISFVLEECCACGVPFFMPTYLQKRLIANKGEVFYCPNGHPQSYQGKTEAQKLKDELEAEKLKNTKEHQDLQNKWLDEMNEKMKLQKQLKRVHNGVCPCCNRSFTNLARHMKNKHPDIIKLLSK